MYAELELKFRRPVDWASASQSIKDVVGANEVSVSTALASSFLSSVPSVVNAGLAAEQLMNAATIVYFREGSDAVRVYIAVRSLAEVKKQCKRIARQLPRRIGRLSAANATVLVSVKGTDEAILTGERLSFASRYWTAIADKFAGKIIPGAVTFALASHFLTGTTAVTSAAIGLVAAGVGAIFEAEVAARGAGDWKWKESS